MEQNPRETLVLEAEQEESTNDGQPKGHLRVMAQQGLEESNHPIYEGSLLACVCTASQISTECCMIML